MLDKRKQWKEAWVAYCFELWSFMFKWVNLVGFVSACTVVGFYQVSPPGFPSFCAGVCSFANISLFIYTVYL